MPGMHAMGIDEPRLTGLSNELAATGLGVVTMELPDLARYRFTPETVDIIEDGARWLSERRDLTPDGKIGLMGISFAGGLSDRRRGTAARSAIAWRSCSRSAATATCRGCFAICARVSSRSGRRIHRGHPPHVRPPHDYGVAVILVGIADRMVPPEQVDRCAAAS